MGLLLSRIDKFFVASENTAPVFFIFANFIMSRTELRRYEPYEIIDPTPTPLSVQIGAPDAKLTSEQVVENVNAAVTNRVYSAEGFSQEGANYPGDENTMKGVLTALGGRRGEYPPRFAPGMNTIALLHENARDRFGRVPFVRENQREVPTGSHIRIMQVMPQVGVLVPVPATTENLVDHALSFTYKPTDAMTVAAPNESGIWNVQTLPHGNIARGPWQGHYANGIITGMDVRTFDDGCFGFRISAHIERLVRDLAADGFGEIDPQMLMSMVRMQVEADRRFIPCATNAFGNRGYVRIDSDLTSDAPPLRGHKNKRELLCATTPVGPYLTNSDQLHVAAIFEARPVIAGGFGGRKSKTNYPGACDLADRVVEELTRKRKKPAEGFHEALFMNGGVVQECKAMNVAFGFNGKGRNGRNLLVRPAMQDRDILPGIVGDSVEKLADYFGCDVRHEDVYLAEATKADVVLLGGTAAGVRYMGQLVGADGALYTHDNNRCETGGWHRIKNAFDSCMRRQEGAPFPDWMEKLCD